MVQGLFSVMLTSLLGTQGPGQGQGLYRQEQGLASQGQGLSFCPSYIGLIKDNDKDLQDCLYLLFGWNMLIYRLHVVEVTCGYI